MKVADLFSGAGGLTLAAKNAHLDVVISADNWDCAIQTHRANFSHDTLKLDLGDVDSTVEAVELYSPDIVMGGPPCQDFSPAGKGVEGTRAALTLSFAQTIVSLRPAIFIMENVPAAAKSKTLDKAKSIWAEAGYRFAQTVVDAAYFGVPQHRKRLLVIGSLEGDPQEAIDTIHSSETVLPMHVRTFWPEVPFEHYYRHPRSYSRRAVFSVNEASPTIRGVNRPRPSSYVPHSQDTSKLKVRALTAAERAKIQSFPDNYIWIGTQAEIEQMIGNSVPPLLGEVILRSVATWKQKKQTTPNDFYMWVLNNTKLNVSGVRNLIHQIRSMDKKFGLLAGSSENERLQAIVGMDLSGLELTKSQTSQYGETINILRTFLMSRKAQKS